ncbi:tryptophan synthase subunit alpha [Alicyclobacillus macrosporangiidus]|uniref:Tryptophan synthase alpha chain n=1 Tax=Alicyclobacillus macrosporangiidus TaxID=392015 RepID=A0A1I7KTT5_9BACL|nr:tryptophan synthase subunit alpha [Alicyclobacillus macrosporangiidus]SFV00817.1 tryptophan synthase, alpha chain [Alicyclobacillus macrosporangiidus]
MERLERAFRKRVDRAAFIPFLNTGDPSFDRSLAFFRAVLRAGADILEIGAPYSDPLADGPVIQASALRSLQAGFRLPQVFEAASALRPETDAGLVLFTYINPVLQYGLERFFSDARTAGADGVVIPDLPFEESDPVRAVADSHGIALIPLVAPTSGEDRIAGICRQARGFVYCVSSLGVTGERARMSARLQELVQTARRYTEVPVAVGFGVSRPDQAHEIAGFADGVIVGSAIVRRIGEAVAAGRGDEALLASVSGFAGALIEALHRTGAAATPTLR